MVVDALKREPRRKAPERVPHFDRHPFGFILPFALALFGFTPGKAGALNLWSVLSRRLCENGGPRLVLSLGLPQETNINREPSHKKHPI